MDDQALGSLVAREKHRATGNGGGAVWVPFWTVDRVNVLEWWHGRLRGNFATSTASISKYPPTETRFKELIDFTSGDSISKTHK